MIALFEWIYGMQLKMKRKIERKNNFCNLTSPKNVFFEKCPLSSLVLFHFYIVPIQNGNR